MESILKKNLIKISILCVHVVLYFLAIQSVTEKIAFSFFSTMFFFLVFSTLNFSRKPVLLYFGLFFWVGFYVKLAIHFVLKYPFVETIGSFDGSPEQWRQFYLAASIAAGMVSIANLGYYYLHFRRSEILPDLSVNPSPIQKLIQNNFKGILFFLILTIATLHIFNMYFGVYIIGLTAKTIYPWPINAVLSWFIYTGMALILCEFLRYSSPDKKKISFSFYVYLFSATYTTISILSRGAIIYQTGPILLALFIHRKELNLTINSLLRKVAVFMAALLLALSIVTGLRSVAFKDWEAAKNNSAESATVFKIMFNDFIGNSGASPPPPNVEYPPLPKTVGLFMSLAVDRWIGVEGLLSMVGFEGKSPGLFWSKQVWGNSETEQNIFNKVSNSIYSLDFSKPYRFTSIPGFVSFLFYSGSLIYIFIGTLIFWLIMVLLDSLVFRLTQNLFATHVFGFWLSNSILQFGIYPMSFVKSLIFSFGYFAILFIFTSYFRKNDFAYRLKKAEQ